jgi:hypothetical protein
MRTILLTTVCGFLLPLAGRADDTKVVLKEIDLKGAKLEPSEGRIKPAEITSGEELARTFADKETQDRIKKEVDFAKHKLVYFAWAGSGQDKLTARLTDGDKKEVVFAYQPGRTRDLRRHFHLFLLSKDTPYRLGR